MKNPLPLFAVALAFSSVALLAEPAADIWSGQCAKCHGTDGAGKTKIGQKLKLKDYSDAKVQAELTDDAMLKAIKNGVTEGGKERMKAFTDLSDDDAKALVAHIRTLKK
jgi:cytochrome c553